MFAVVKLSHQLSYVCLQLFTVFFYNLVSAVFQKRRKQQLEMLLRHNSVINNDACFGWHHERSMVVAKR